MEVLPCVVSLIDGHSQHKENVGIIDRDSDEGDNIMETLPRAITQAMHSINAAEQQTNHRPAHELLKSAPPGPESCINNVGQPPEGHSKTTTQKGADACMHAGDGHRKQRKSGKPRTNIGRQHCSRVSLYNLLVPFCTPSVQRSDGATGAAQHAHAMPSWVMGYDDLKPRWWRVSGELWVVSDEVCSRNLGEANAAAANSHKPAVGDHRAEWIGRARAVSNKRVVPIWTNEIESQLQNMVVIQNNMKRSWR
ncbi:hypothetical protein F5144DRAFT_543117 [Chaetomium tenue]|uniref:Uncharacterized protein n=1 Tax=Chaetomium tenue TaxID=1854479 RepID=A0ACB7PMD9_9PEZI|nr:hypothetical protein F5144DRAFT_543117 [Chaetomium globosum]